MYVKNTVLVHPLQIYYFQEDKYIKHQILNIEKPYKGDGLDRLKMWDEFLIQYEAIWKQVINHWYD